MPANRYPACRSSVGHALQHDQPPHRRSACIAATVLWLIAAVAGAAPPSAYVKRDSWFASLLAARETLMQTTAADARSGMATYTSEVVRGGQPAREIRIPLHDAREVYLYVTGAPEVVGGAADWAKIQLIDREGQATQVSRFPGLAVLDGRHEIDCTLESGVSGPLKIAGRQFQHGLHVYAHSKVRLQLDRHYEYLHAWIGVDDWVGERGGVRFHVTDARGAARLDLWSQLELDFPDGASRREMKRERDQRLLDRDWQPGDWAGLAGRYAAACEGIPELARTAAVMAAEVRDLTGLQAVRQLYHRCCELEAAASHASQLNLQRLRLALEDLQATFGERYPRGGEFSARLDALQRELGSTAPAGLESLERIATLADRFDRLQQEILLANPLLDFERLLLIRRTPDGDPRRPHGAYGVAEYLGMPRQSSKCNPGIERPFSWDNEIAILSPVSPVGSISTVYKPPDNRLITDLDLHWDADRILFSMPGSHDRWHVFEIASDGSGLRQLTPGDHPDVHFYDACYLPNGEIALVSTAPLQGVPCNAGVIVGMMYMMDGRGGNLRQVCFEQDHTYCPTVLNDGRILYLRWDYTDTPHVWNRVLFSMNPDGTNQAEFYGSNSYWPNSVFFARPIPEHPTKIVGIVTGHHVGRVGELVIFDPAMGRHETEGVVQRIPGYGQRVAPLIEDKLTEHSWPKFVHPYPLSEKHFLVSCKPEPDSLWGIYLVDVFDNRVLLHEIEGEALLEPIPLRSAQRPPVIPSKVQPDQQDATVYLSDIYTGPGLAGVPRGTVKQLRVFTYHFGYQQLAGIDHRVGADGPWEVKRVLGTVPVQADGSALFRIPAKTPISIQPLDAEGKALQLMRSWMTAMPGETLSCVGCHEQRNTAPPADTSLAAARRPVRIKPWYGKSRGFSFQREVQPVLDRHCIGCHDGQPRNDGRHIVDLRGDQGALLAYRHGDPQLIRFAGVSAEDLQGKYRGIFPPAYIALRQLVRVGGLESDLHLLPPKEFHADTSELVQMLRKGHHGVQLDAEGWDRLITWIDLNAPCHGTWHEFTPIRGDQRQRRVALRELYGGVAEDWEEPPTTAPTGEPIKPILPEPPVAPQALPIACDGWPFDADEARRLQQAAGLATRRIELGGGQAIELVRIPAGRFVMGSWEGPHDEQPPAALTVHRPFWIGRTEVTNAQFQQFDPQHDSRFEHRTSWIFSQAYLGWPLNGPQQPVVRVSWEQAVAFCRWLSEQSGLEVTLPTEAQWEYACRAGAATPFWYGNADTDLAPYANLADRNIRRLAYEGWRPLSPDLVPRDDRWDDGYLVTADVGGYAANPWGLHDVHGNVWEWTRSAYRAYPYDGRDGREDSEAEGDRVVRGGSWYDRPVRATSSFRLAYPPYQRVYNVGFRVAVEDGEA